MSEAIPRAANGLPMLSGRYAVRTTTETAKMMGITRQRVQQIEKRALLKVRRAFERLGVTCPEDGL